MRIKPFMLALVLITMQQTCSTDETTLQSVAEHYCQGNESRQVAEFREGIYDIGEGEVWPGVKLQINRWD